MIRLTTEKLWPLPLGCHLFPSLLSTRSSTCFHCWTCASSTLAVKVCVVPPVTDHLRFPTDGLPMICPWSSFPSHLFQSFSPTWDICTSWPAAPKVSAFSRSAAKPPGSPQMKLFSSFTFALHHSRSAWWLALLLCCCMLSAAFPGILRLQPVLETFVLVSCCPYT